MDFEWLPTMELNSKISAWPPRLLCDWHNTPPHPLPVCPCAQSILRYARQLPPPDFVVTDSSAWSCLVSFKCLPPSQVCAQFTTLTKRPSPPPFLKEHAPAHHYLLPVFYLSSQNTTLHIPFSGLSPHHELQSPVRAEDGRGQSEGIFTWKNIHSTIWVLSCFVLFCFVFKAHGYALRTEFLSESDSSSPQWCLRSI